MQDFKKILLLTLKYTPQCDIRWLNSTISGITIWSHQSRLTGLAAETEWWKNFNLFNLFTFFQSIPFGAWYFQPYKPFNLSMANSVPACLKVYGAGTSFETGLQTSWWVLHISSTVNCTFSRLRWAIFGKHEQNNHLRRQTHIQPRGTWRHNGHHQREGYSIGASVLLRK